MKRVLVFRAREGGSTYWHTRVVAGNSDLSRYKLLLFLAGFGFQLYIDEYGNDLMNMNNNVSGYWDGWMDGWTDGWMNE